MLFTNLLFLRRFLSHVRFKFHKLFRHFVVTSLPQDSQNRPTSFVFWNALEKWQPSGTRSLKKENKMNKNVLKIVREISPDLQYPSVAKQQHQQVDLHEQNSSHECRCEAHRNQDVPLMLC